METFSVFTTRGSRLPQVSRVPCPQSFDAPVQFQLGLANVFMEHLGVEFDFPVLPFENEDPVSHWYVCSFFTLGGILQGKQAVEYTGKL